MLRKPPLTNWEDSQTDASLLTFAQRFEEALFDYTMDSFRAPALNSLGRAKELFAAADECDRGSLKPHALDSISEELAHSLRVDDAARAVLGGLSSAYTDKRLWQKASVEDLRSHAEVLFLRLGNGAYTSALTTRVREAIDSDDLGAVDAYTPLLAVQLIDEGYSREYLFHSVRSFFFLRREGEHRIDGLASFDAFLDYFHRELQPWTVVFRTAECLSVTQSLLRDDRFEVRLEPPELETDLRMTREWLDRPLDDDEIFVLLKDFEDRDAQRAHLRALRVLEMMTEYVRFHLHRQPINRRSQALVVPAEGDPVVLSSPKPATEKRPEPHRNRLEQDVVATFKSLSPTTLRGESTERFFASLQMHGSGIQANTEEAQLLALWSALESFLPLSNADDGIKRLKQLALPILSLGYPMKILSYLHIALEKTVRTKLSPLLQEVPENLADSELGRFIAILFDDDLHALRDELMELCSSNPLLRFRLQSYRRRFGTGGGILVEVEAHHQRVDWHLSRLYRARNALVHAGRLPENARPLIENLHDYYHEVVSTVSRTYARYDTPISIEAVVAGLGAAYQEYLEELRRASKTGICHENARLFLSGPDV